MSGVQRALLELIRQRGGGAVAVRASGDHYDFHVVALHQILIREAGRFRISDIFTVIIPPDRFSRNLVPYQICRCIPASGASVFT